MKTLEYLLLHRGRLVSRDELLEQVWEKKALTDHAISVVITSLRQALEDDARNPTYLKTVRKKGYCLVEERVSEAPSKQLTSSSGNKGTMVLIAAVLFVALLLPVWFFPSSHSDKVTVFLTPLTEENTEPQLSSRLSVINDLLLMELARYADVRLVKDDEVTNDAAAESMFEVSGTVNTAAQSLEITLNTISGGEGVLYSEDSSLGLPDITLAVRSLVSNIMAGYSVVTPNHERREEIDILLDRARYFWGFHRADRNKIAYRIVRQLMEDYPANGDVHAFLAEMYAALPGSAWGLDGIDTLELAEQHIQRAVELGANAKYIWRTKARIIHERDQDYIKAATLYRKALEHDPTDAWNWRSMALSHAVNSDFDAALEAHDRAIELSLEPTGALTEKMITLYFAGRFKEAAALKRELSGLDGRPSVRTALIYHMAGDLDASFREWQRFFDKAELPDLADFFAEQTPAGNVSELYKRAAGLLAQSKKPVSPYLMAYLLFAASDYEAGAALITAEMQNIVDTDPRKNRSLLFLRIDPLVKQFEHNDAVRDMLRSMAA